MLIKYHAFARPVTKSNYKLVQVCIHEGRLEPRSEVLSGTSGPSTSELWLASMRLGLLYGMYWGLHLSARCTGTLQRLERMGDVGVSGFYSFRARETVANILSGSVALRGFACAELKAEQVGFWREG